MSWTDRLHPYDPEEKKRGELVGLIFDIQRFAIHDGKGIRTLVFLKGCPLRCAWCQNPESMAAHPEIVYLPHNCIDAGRCLGICPEDAIQPTTEVKRVIDRQRCTLCGECVEFCYAGAMNIIGRYLTVDQVLAEVERDRKFYRHSEGGVTFSGGEPTAQPAFLEAVLRLAHERHLSTAIETCGYTRWETLSAILRHVDLVLYDLKHMDSAEHRRLTGVPNELILENLKRTAGMGINVHVRLPLIPGSNDSMENVRATAAFAASVPGVQRLDILPYHRLGEPKWDQLDRAYSLHGVRPHEREQVYHLADVARGYDLEVNIGG